MSTIYAGTPLALKSDDGTELELATSLVRSNTGRFDNGLTVGGNTNLLGGLKFNGFGPNVPYSSIVMATGANTQQWIELYTISRISEGFAIESQDLNVDPGPAYVDLKVPSIGGPVGTTSHLFVPQSFNQLNSTDLECRFTAVYDVDINVLYDNSSTGIGNSWITLGVEIDGTEQEYAVVSHDYGLSGKISNLVISSGQIIRIVRRQVNGTGTLVTWPPMSGPQTFTSTVTLTCVRFD